MWAPEQTTALPAARRVVTADEEAPQLSPDGDLTPPSDGVLCEGATALREMCVERQVERVKKYGGWGCRCNVRRWSGEDVETTGESPTVGRVGLGQKKVGVSVLKNHLS